MSDTPPRAPAERILVIIEWLCRALGNHVPRPGKPGLPDALLVLIWKRLRRLAKRITRVAAKIDAGIPPAKPCPHRPRSEQKPKPPPQPAPQPAQSPPPFRLPRDRGWLIRLIGHDAAGGGSQLRHLLAQPDAAPLLADPRMARLLRPLCHMLHVDLPPQIAKPRPRPGPAIPPSPEGAKAPLAATAAAATPRPSPPPQQPASAPLPRTVSTTCGPPPLPA